MTSVDFDRLRITNRLLVREAISRGWQVSVADYRTGLVSYLIPGKGEMLVSGVNGPFTNAINVLISDDKILAAIFAKKAGLNLPESLLLKDQAQANEFLQRYAPIVVKPIDSAHGQGVSVGIKDADSLQAALPRARRYSKNILLQQQVNGLDLRLVFIGQAYTAAAIRKPAEVVGDGTHSLGQLIGIENNSGWRAPNYLLPINNIDEEAARVFLGKTIDRIASKDEVVQVVGTANIGTGGYSIDVTDELPKFIIDQAQKLVQMLDMSICGVDFIWDQQVNKAYFIELNANPSFGLHVYPAKGKSRPLAKIFLDWLEAK